MLTDIQNEEYKNNLKQRLQRFVVIFKELGPLILNTDVGRQFDTTERFIQHHYLKLLTTAAAQPEEFFRSVSDWGPPGNKEQIHDLIYQLSVVLDGFEITDATQGEN